MLALMSEKGDVTQLLLDVQSGNRDAAELLAPLIYDELRRVARGVFSRERPGHTLQPTAVANDVFMRLIESSRVDWQSRAHFMGIAARGMRQILVDHARSRNRVKRGGDAARVPLDERLAFSDEKSPEILALDDALNALSKLDPRQAQIIEMRFFGGLTGEEIAEALEISTATVTRELRVAQMWLYREMNNTAAG
jgi:RNA polymerase sigma factor (TIGR02999 family)